MATLVAVQIFPAIGIARIGNSPEWFLGPELPYPAPPPPPPGGAYKDDQCRIKRQAQRFRLWGFYSDGSTRELTTADGDIVWTVHLANAKPTVSSEGIIDGGLQTLTGPAANATFVGTFAGVNVPLGEAETDAEGRLIVIGGYGTSANPTDLGSMPNFPNTPGWYDDVSDGPVTARITIGGTPHDAVAGAWVICPPPRFAPTTYAITSLYDTLRQLAITAAQLPAPGQPVFTTDVYPILLRALGMRWVTAFTFSPGDHDTLNAFAPPGGSGDTLANRQNVYARLRPAGNMPLLNDIPTSSSQLADFQLSFMQQWSNGQVTEDWPLAVPSVITPAGLTQAALENCVGAAFYPGIEAGGIPQGTPLSKTILELPFAEAFRLDQTMVSAGDVTKPMARPWQGDFMLCTGPESQTGVDSDQLSWWPSARPIGIYPFDDHTNKRLWTLGIATTMADMVQNWHELGFIVDTGLDRPVETEKTNVCKSCFIITDRSEIGKSEAQALADTGQTIDDAFYVVVQGVAPSVLGITSTSPLSPSLALVAPKFSSLPPSGMKITPADVVFQYNDVNQVQRITFGYNIGFTNTNAFTAADVPVPLTATAAGLSGSAVIDLTLQPDPYMVDGATSYLSADTRVFRRQPGEKFAQQTLHNDPNAFIKDVIDSLRTSAQAKSWFDGLPSDEAGSELIWSPTLNHKPVYNFAICRVRYRSETTPADKVRVFFRLFPAMTTSTDYQPSTTYRTGGEPGTKIPLLGIVGGEVTTIPFFAEPRKSATANLNKQTDPKNIDKIPADSHGNETYGYFGCWLDFNQPTDKRFPIMPIPLNGGPFAGPEPLQSIADLIRGVHQCLVAEISFDGDPISTGATTANSDKLAQRNLSIDFSDNPGSAATHQVQHSFAIRPTTAALAPGQRPDELMIRWGTTPLGSVGTLYLPGLSGSDVIQMADRLYTRHSLELRDPHSIAMPVTGGVTYVPIPSSASGDVAGLLTVDLPATVRAGQTFRIVLHQVIDRLAQRPLLPAAQRTALASQGVAVARAAATRRPPPGIGRHILGSFQFSILVQTKNSILPFIERSLVNLQRVIGTIPVENHWYPVLLRYLEQVTARIHAFGGPAPRPPGHPGGPSHGPGEERTRFEGKVAGIRFDRFGDFEGFVLDTEDGLRDFFSREREVEALASKAWRRRIAILVVAEKDDEHKPLSITLLRPPVEDK